MFSNNQRLRVLEYERRSRVKLDKKQLMLKFINPSRDDWLKYVISQHDMYLFAKYLSSQSRIPKYSNIEDPTSKLECSNNNMSVINRMTILKNMDSHMSNSDYFTNSKSTIQTKILMFKSVMNTINGSESVLDFVSIQNGVDLLTHYLHQPRITENISDRDIKVILHSLSKVSRRYDV